jgi:hypothetical protein
MVTKTRANYHQENPDDILYIKKMSSGKNCICENEEKNSGKLGCFIWMI